MVEKDGTDGHRHRHRHLPDHLNSDHLLISEILGWISPEMQSANMLSDRFDVVHHRGRSDIEQRIVAEIRSLYPEVT